MMTRKVLIVKMFHLLDFHFGLKEIYDLFYVQCACHLHFHNIVYCCIDSYIIFNNIIKSRIYLSPRERHDVYTPTTDRSPYA